jgi:hypothetical protein
MERILAMATDVVGSRMKALNGYGQNGYAGPSSDDPNKKTGSGFLPAPDLDAAYKDNPAHNEYNPGQTASGKFAPRANSKGGNMQGPLTRTVSDTPFPLAHGMSDRSDRSK